MLNRYVLNQLTRIDDIVVKFVKAFLHTLIYLIPQSKFHRDKFHAVTPIKNESDPPQISIVTENRSLPSFW